MELLQTDFCGITQHFPTFTKYIIPQRKINVNTYFSFFGISLSLFYWGESIHQKHLSTGRIY